MIVKICGLKTLEHSLVACEAGAQMLGFNFYEPSPRYIEVGFCRELVQKIKKAYPSVICVGVFVNHSPDEVLRTLNTCDLDLAQLAGDESPAEYSDLGNKVFKAYRSKTVTELLERLAGAIQRETAPAFLLDAYQKEAFGGSGQVGNWKMASEISARYDVLLAGGLNPQNVALAIEQVNPWGVDVASGVERVRGEKDSTLIRQFIRAASQNFDPERLEKQQGNSHE